MNLQSKIGAILQKLNQPDCAISAEKEIKSLIVNEIDDGEKLSILINCIAEGSSTQFSKKNKSKQLKLYISIAEIFQHQILEFLPKIFSKLNKKIKEGDLEIADIIAETYGGLIEYSFRGAEEEEAKQILEECLKGLFELNNKGFKNIQIIASMCITKIIQNCLIEILKDKFMFIYTNLTQILEDKNTKSHFCILESILSLILSVQDQVSQITDQFPQILLRFVHNSDSKTRKICVDTFYTLCAIDSDMMKQYHEELHSILQKLKADKNKLVREAAMECLKVIVPIKKSIQEERISNKRTVPQQRSKKEIKTKTKVVLNKKINLDHVKSTIDKKKINNNFMEQNQTNQDTEIYFKEPVVKVDYDQFYEENQKKLIEIKQAENFEKIKNKKTNKKFEPLPNFDQTNKAIFDNQDAMYNYVVSKPQNLNKISQRNLLNESNNIHPSNQSLHRSYREENSSPKPFKNISSQRIMTPFETHPEENLENPEILYQTQYDEKPDYATSKYQENKNHLNLEREIYNKNYEKFLRDSVKDKTNENNENKGEIETLKKYIKILNGKVKEMSSTVNSLKSSNNILVNKVSNLEKMVISYSSYFQDKKGNFQTFAENYHASGINQSDPNSNFPVLLFSQAQTNSNNKTESSKWNKKKEHKNINDEIFDIFSDKTFQEKEFINFLRLSENLRNFQKIENSLLIKIFKKLILLLNKNINGDILVLEYTLLWIKTFLNNRQPLDKELIQQLYTVLFLLVNTSHDEATVKKAKFLINHHFVIEMISGKKENNENNIEDDDDKSYQSNEYENDYSIEEK